MNHESLTDPGLTIFRKTESVGIVSYNPSHYTVVNDSTPCVLLLVHTLSHFLFCIKSKQIHFTPVDTIQDNSMEQTIIVFDTSGRCFISNNQ